MSIARVRVELRRSDDDDPRRRLEGLIKAFRKAVDQSGVQHECKERMYYEKPSEKRRRKKRQRQYQIEIENRERNERQSRGSRRKNKS
jgi:ribosomal protein S21